MQQAIIIDKSDLHDVIRDVLTSSYNQEVDSHTACQILGISEDTLTSWVKAGIIHPTTPLVKGKHRRFILSELLSTSKKELSKQYRQSRK